MTLSPGSIASTQELIRQNPGVLLTGSPLHPGLEKIVRQCDPVTFLPNAGQFLGEPGSPVKRIILHRKRTAREQRSLVILCRGEKGACILKPAVNDGEPAAAQKAGEIAVGPTIYLLLDPLIIEQYIPGKPVIDWWYHRLTSEYFGRSLGKLLAALHLNNLFYIDFFFPHLYLAGNGLWRLIDFGCAVHFTGSGSIDRRVITWFEERSGQSLSGLDTPSLCAFLRQHDYNTLKKEIRTGIFPIPLCFSFNYRRKAVSFFEACYHEEFGKG